MLQSVLRSEFVRGIFVVTLAVACGDGAAPTHSRENVDAATDGGSAASDGQVDELDGAPGAVPNDGAQSAHVDGGRAGISDAGAPKCARDAAEAMAGACASPDAATGDADEDGDGVPRGEDCDDTLPELSQCTGEIEWATAAGFGEGGDDAGHDIAVAADGSVFATGVISGSAVFGAGEPGQTALYAVTHETSGFIARYSPSGGLMWAQRIGGRGDASGLAIATLPDGAAIVTGSFTGSLTLGGDATNPITYEALEGVSNIFIARYSASGALDWARQVMGGRRRGAAWDVATGADGSLMITGEFSGSAIFGAGETHETTLTSAGLDDRADIFVARYASNGMLEWAVRAGGADADFGFGISVLADGSALVTGSFRATATFGQGEGNETVLVSPPRMLQGIPSATSDTFVARYAPDGTLTWATNEGGAPGFDDAGYVVEALADGSCWIGGDSLARYDAAGNRIGRDSAVGNILGIFPPERNITAVKALPGGAILVTGSISGSWTFGPGEEAETTLVSQDSGSDPFVARYEADGTLAWARRAATTLVGRTIGLAALADGSFWITGRLSGTAVFQTESSTELRLESPENEDILVASYSADGAPVWATKAGGAWSWETAASIAAVADGSALVGGTFAGNTLFGRGEPRETVLQSAGGSDAFVARFNPDSTLAWLLGAGGSGDDAIDSLAASPDGSVFAVGTFRETAAFGAGEASEVLATDDAAIFIVKYEADGSLAWVKRGGEDARAWSIDVHEDGSAIVAGALFTGTATFGEGEPNEARLVAPGAAVFLAQYDPDGALAWARVAATGDLSRPGGMTVAADGSIWLTGGYSASVTFGGDGAASVTLGDPHPDSGHQLYVARFDDQGRLLWARNADGEAYSQPTSGGRVGAAGLSVAALPDGSALVAGQLVGSVTFGPGEAHETMLESAGEPGSSDIFVARYQSDGLFAWGTRAGGAGRDTSRGIAPLPNGGALLAFSSSVARLHPDGTTAWFQRLSAGTTAIAALADGSSLILGSLVGDAVLGGRALSKTGRNPDIWLARLAP